MSNSCPKCSSPIEADWQVCPTCGERLKEPDTSQPVAPLRSGSGIPRPPAAPQFRGYLSKEHRDKFKKRVILLAVAFGISQFLIPLVFVGIMFYSLFSSGFGMGFTEPQRGTFWNDALWYPEESFNFTSDSGFSTELKRIRLTSDARPEEMQKLTMDDPWLLAGDDGIWVISSSALAHYSDNGLTIVSEEEQSWDISSVFLYKGQPSVVNRTSKGFSLITYTNGRWEQQSSIDVPGGLDTSAYPPVSLQVLSNGNEMHYFFCNEESIYYGKGASETGMATPSNWQSIFSNNSDWQAIWLDGQPAVFRLVTTEGIHQEIEGLRLSDGQWTTFFSHEIGLPLGFGIYPSQQDGEFAMLVQSFPGSIKLFQIDGNAVVSEEHYGSWFPFPRSLLLIVLLLNSVIYVIPFIVAVILSYLMHKYREHDHTVGEMSMPYASLTRRALAKAIDIVLASWLMGVGYLFQLKWLLSGDDFADAFLSSPSHLLVAYGLVFVGMLWALATFVLFSYSEGRWGTTPGKWLLGIRVMRTDLQPCGFGKGLIRNLVLIADGFFNFMIAMMFVALTEKWQRVGDIAAGTIVVDKRKGHIATSSGPQAQDE